MENLCTLSASCLHRWPLRVTCRHAWAISRSILLWSLHVFVMLKWAGSEPPLWALSCFMKRANVHPSVKSLRLSTNTRFKWDKRVTQHSNTTLLLTCNLSRLYSRTVAMAVLLCGHRLSHSYISNTAVTVTQCMKQKKRFLREDSLSRPRLLRRSIRGHLATPVWESNDSSGKISSGQTSG